MLRTSRGKTILFALTLVIATLALYQSSLHNGFVNYDDPQYITENRNVQRGLSWSGVVWACNGIHVANWHPLTWISHMADVQFFGLNPLGHHLTSVLIHAFNVIALFLLLRLATGYIARSAAVAALFAVHPLNVESVAWISERKNVLCTAFLLLTLFAYGWYLRRPNVLRYLILALLFALALMAKPMAIALPLALLVLDYWPLGRLSFPAQCEAGTWSATLLKLAMEKLPLFILSVASALITIWGQYSAETLANASALPLSFRVKNAVYSYFSYIVKGVWPLDLAVFYPYHANKLAPWKVVIAAFTVVVISALVWRFRERRYLLAGWLWYLITMFPMIGLVQVGLQAMADRYAYITFFGLFVMVVWLTADLVERIKLSQTAVVFITIATLLGFASLSYAQILYWRNSYTLFSHALEVTQDNGVAEVNLGAALVAMGRPDLAMPHLNAATRLTPEFFPTHYNLATLLQHQNRLDLAEREFRVALLYATDPAEAAHCYNNLGVLYIQLNQPERALTEFNAAIRLDADEQNSLVGRGTINYQHHNLDAAVADFSRASKVSPSPIAYLWLGRALQEKGEFGSAANAFEAALRLAPGSAEARTRLDALRSQR